MFFSRKKFPPYLIDAGEFLELTEHVSRSHCQCHTALPYESTDKSGRMKSLDFRDVRKVLLTSIEVFWVNIQSLIALLAAAAGICDDTLVAGVFQFTCQQKWHSTDNAIVNYVCL